MPIQWNDSDLQRFFGTALVGDQDGDPTDRVYELDYAGKRLKYRMMLLVDSDIVSISGDPELPFGADSLFEIIIPCDSISLCSDGYYPGQAGLAFWYGSTAHPHNCTMQLLKRPDGDLKVWPGYAWPTRHPNFKMIWGENSPPLAYEPPGEGPR